MPHGAHWTVTLSPGEGSRPERTVEAMIEAAMIDCRSESELVTG